MSAPTPPVPLKDHCSIIHDNVLYVYSPEAFQTLPLEDGGKWSQEQNGVSVTGATCVKGGVDGDNNKPALYIVGGVANGSSSNYSGLQRYSIPNKSWQTISPVVPVTKHRQNHGAAYMNASSALIVYGGSQNGDTGPSSETFLMEMYPPYRVQAYSSLAPPAVKPFMLSWSDDRALMVGGSSVNQNIFTFGPTDGWQDLGLALPSPLPEQPAAQAAVFNLADGSKILQTFKLDQVPMSVTTNVLLNPGGQPAAFNETVGVSTTASTAAPTQIAAARSKRQTFLFNYPSYNGSDSPETVRNGFSIAQRDDGLVAFVGGDTNSTVAFFNQSENSWIQPTALLGNQPQTTPIPGPTSVVSSIPTSSPSGGASSGSHDTRHGLVILGGVLGGICGLAAILIVILLSLRNIRRSKRREEEKARGSPAPDNKTWGDFSFEEGMLPLSRQGQPMGRSPVPSSVGLPLERGKSTMLQPRPSEKHLIRRVSTEAIAAAKSEPASDHHPSFAQSRLRRDKSPLTISKPMNPDLGHYNARPSIDLGRATPASPINATAMVTAIPVPQRNRSQRKTDEAWAKYFAGGKVDPTTTYGNQSTTAARSSAGFWPGSGVGEKSMRSPKLALRDSAGNLLQPRTVAAASPTLESGPANQNTRNLTVARGIPAKISSADSVSSDGDYEDQELDPAFSSGIPDSVHETWTPVGSNSSGQGHRGVAGDLPPPSSSTKTSNTSGTGSSGIPNFPMPTPSNRSVRLSGGNSTLVSVENVQIPRAIPAHVASRQRREPSDYFTRGPGRDGIPTNNDMSWLNLGTEQNR